MRLQLIVSPLRVFCASALWSARVFLHLHVSLPNQTPPKKIKKIMRKDPLNYLTHLQTRVRTHSDSNLLVSGAVFLLSKQLQPWLSWRHWACESLTAVVAVARNSAPARTSTIPTAICLGPAVRLHLSSSHLSQLNLAHFHPASTFTGLTLFPSFHPFISSKPLFNNHGRLD